jgi:ferredoxin/flavodoxin---NADP+ reductase
MFKILKKIELNKYVSKMTLEAPNVARAVNPGQFIILRVDEVGERIPLTVFDYNRTLGTIDIIYQKVGTTTLKLDQKKEGEYILDVVGPLGKKSELGGFTNAVVVAGGVGCAIAYPLAKGLKNNGCRTTIVAGFRNCDIIILENEMKDISDDFTITTDDGSNGKKGFVTDVLLEKLAESKDYDLIIAVGPLPMMKAVCDVTKKFGIKTTVSMTAIMVDGTGMCGGCRLTVGGKVKFACVDGPDFDGHQVDFDEACARSRTFAKEEQINKEKYCKMFKGARL